jgi:hypothetical protein
MRGRVTQLPLDFTPHHSAIELMAQASRQRVLDGVVDAWGKHRPEGPRKQLTEAQRRAYDQHQGRAGPDNAATLGSMR